MFFALGLTSQHADGDQVLDGHAGGPRRPPRIDGDHGQAGDAQRLADEQAAWRLKSSPAQAHHSHTRGGGVLIIILHIHIHLTFGSCCGSAGRRSAGRWIAGRGSAGRGSAGRGSATHVAFKSVHPSRGRKLVTFCSVPDICSTAQGCSCEGMVLAVVSVPPPLEAVDVLPLALESPRASPFR